MSDLKLNPDGTVTIPLRGNPKQIILPEPSMAQLAQLHTIVHDADESLPEIITIDTEIATQEEMRAATDRLTERTMLMYSDDPPYGNAILDMIHLLVPDSHNIDKDALPGWAANPTTCRRILTHFQTPLAG